MLFEQKINKIKYLLPFHSVLYNCHSSSVARHATTLFKIIPCTGTVGWLVGWLLMHLSVVHFYYYWNNNTQNATGCSEFEINFLLPELIVLLTAFFWCQWR